MAPVGSSVGLKMVTCMPVSRHGRQRGSHRRLELIPSQTTLHAVIDGRHDGIVENISIKMKPEPIEIGPGKLLERTRDTRLNPTLPYLAEVDERDSRLFDALASMRLGFFRIASAKGDDILIPDERMEAPISVTIRGPRPVASASSIDAASPLGSASG